MRVRTAVVTASGSGIGRACALCLAEEGVSVAVVDIDADGATETVRLIRADGGTAFSLVGDCVDPASIATLATEAEQGLGTIDALVNNMGGAAGADIGPFETQRLEVFRRVIDQCLLSTMVWTRALIPGMLATGYGKVVNIASDTAFLGEIAMAEYVASKAGVIGVARSLAREYGDRGITVNAVAPGPINAGGVTRVPADQLERALINTPLGRLGEPREVGSAVAFFVSTDADFITGQTLVVGGGRAMH
jgi:NAD(P)-dependent dehydrogenase (short-subunit alcohol dehydrogenase family)